MEKYQKVPREKDPMNSNEIRVSSNGAIRTYLNDANRMFEQEELKQITIKATGKAIARAVTAAEVIKRRFRGLHQITRVGSIPITDVYEPLEEGLDKVIHERIVSFIEVTLSKDVLDEKDPGYQPPLDDSEVNESPENGGSRGGFRGRGRGGGFYNRGFRSRGGYRGSRMDGYRGGRHEGYGRMDAYRNQGFRGGEGGFRGGEGGFRGGDGGFRGGDGGFRGRGGERYRGGGRGGFRSGGGFMGGSGYGGYRNSYRGGGGYRGSRGRGGYRGSP